ncbi:hypothetical protein [Halostreptopolyspora alba]|uniref:Uncharacterized protein n=1 Tax=Halostreptopolyspora alba TaxID=2487137 RepID=A0A3N0EDX6_9ACTN|nr:hypothetical protein EFW17_05575 [Nocardiopsaceae bacterium YIM 96095]
MAEDEGSPDGRGELTEDLAKLILDGGPLGAENRKNAREAGGPRKTVQMSHVLELHVCMGLNACQGHDVTGECPLPGTGSCATVQHVCHGDNECRGQGGCGYLGREYEQTIPGEQACSQNGSCASPINESRVVSGGPFKGTGVWKLARKRFEQRMWQAGRPFHPSPGEGIPDDYVPLYESRDHLMHPAPEGAVPPQRDEDGLVEISGLPEYEGGG